MREADRSTATWVTWRGERPSGLFVRRCRLEVVAGPDRGLTRDLDRAVIRVGARREADLTLADPSVSGLHLEIRLGDDGYLLRDLGSTNGTFVAGHRVREIHAHPGTLIDVGRSRLRFEPLAGAAEVPLVDSDRFEGLIGRSAAMRALFAQLDRVAATDTTVLVSGPTGAGKELVAEALHARSARARGPMVIVDGGALPANLVETELFGHERGAFTGAVAAAAGAFERAHGGTLFLDEVGELPLELQPALLRALESRRIRRVGGARPIEVDFRVVAATNRDLAVEVNRGRFRADLYYRLAVTELRLPPLSERTEDIPLLAAAFAERLTGGTHAGFAPDVLAQLRRHPWPGNVRELRNAVERLVALGDDPKAAIGGGPRAPAALPQGAADTEIDLSVPFRVARTRLTEAFERRYVDALLAAHAGNVSAAARAAGVDRMALHRMIARLGLRGHPQA